MSKMKFFGLLVAVCTSLNTAIANENIKTDITQGDFSFANKDYQAAEKYYRHALDNADSSVDDETRRQLLVKLRESLAAKQKLNNSSPQVEQTSITAQPDKSTKANGLSALNDAKASGVSASRLVQLYDRAILENPEMADRLLYQKGIAIMVRDKWKSDEYVTTLKARLHVLQQLKRYKEADSLNSEIKQAEQANDRQRQQASMLRPIDSISSQKSSISGFTAAPMSMSRTSSPQSSGSLDYKPIQSNQGYSSSSSFGDGNSIYTTRSSGDIMRSYSNR